MARIKEDRFALGSERQVMSDAKGIVLFSTHNARGGAAKAAMRVHDAFLASGHNSNMIVRFDGVGRKNISAVNLAGFIPRAMFKLRNHTIYRRALAEKPKYVFNKDLGLPLRLSAEQDRLCLEADFFGLLWVNDFISSDYVRFLWQRYRKPIVWYLMDMEPITGGCNYPFDCIGYEQNCGLCPLLQRPSERDASFQIMRKKKKHYEAVKLGFASPSPWVTERVMASALGQGRRAEYVPLPIDETIFKPISKNWAREILGLPRDASILFCGSGDFSDRRKGMDILKRALHQLGRDLRREAPVESEKVLITVAAKEVSLSDWGAIPFPVKPLGFAHDDVALALFYQSADLFVSPSIQDAGPMMVSESLLCGTPVVSFNTGVASAMIEEGVNGRIVEEMEPEPLSKAIAKQILTDADMAVACRAAGLRHAPKEFVRGSLDFVNRL